MKKLILACPYSLGDIVMLTAAVRDLHKSYPRQFVTDVRDSFPEVWEHNPYLTRLDENDPDARILKCHYPLINRSNELPYHALHGFRMFLNQRLGLDIQPTAFKGDIHISREEKNWFSQVQELTGQDTAFWIIAAGGKFDVTIKWWDTERYQEVVDYFRGEIQFVQVGDKGHHHPPLKGVIDLRGRTDVRQLIRLVYHSQGVLCGITSLMHLAVAVEVKQGRPAHRPCVVVAGGREAVHWAAYPSHQFIHTVGALRCCARGGCWRSRTFPLGDGERGDQPGFLCVDVIGNLARCMDMISADAVIKRIETYFDGGALKYLSLRQAKAAAKGIRAARANDFDELLTDYTAREASEKFIQTIPKYPGSFQGRGIVICSGGVDYFTCAWVCIHMLRKLGCTLPIQLWHLGKREVDATMKALLVPLQVECVDACEVRKRHPARILTGWELKPYAIIHCPFKEVMLLDADNVPVVNPEFLFDTPQFKKAGAIFWPDYRRLERSRAIWKLCGVPYRHEPEFESGQIVLDKETCWRVLALTMWYNEHSDFFYRHIHGDKDTYHLAFRKLKQPWAMPPYPIHTLRGTMCQHDFKGNRIFQHRNLDKWDLFLRNRPVKDFWREKQCRDFVEQLRRLWDGGMRAYRLKHPVEFRVSKSKNAISPVTIKAVMISCTERTRLRKQTLRNLAATDWKTLPVAVQIDTRKFKNKKVSQNHTAYLALRRGLKSNAEYILFLEDDLKFNRFLLHNLRRWQPLKDRQVTLASLYNPNLRKLAGDVGLNAFIVHPETVFGSQAFLLSRAAVKYVLKHWDEVEGMQDIRISRLAARLKRPVYYHCPSLVQHVGAKSVWGGHFHQARDFDSNWKAA